jgi:hypothetical protein
LMHEHLPHIGIWERKVERCRNRIDTHTYYNRWISDSRVCETAS